MGSYLGDSVLLYLEELKAQADKVLGGMNQILAASSALLADFRYALMSAQSQSRA